MCENYGSNLDNSIKSYAHFKNLRFSLSGAVPLDFEKMDVERDCSNPRLISASWFENSQTNFDGAHVSLP